MLATEITQGIVPAELGQRAVAAEFRGLLEGGARLCCAGAARSDPEGLLSRGYTPKHKLALFDATFYLTNLREDHNFRFFVAYVVLHPDPPAAPRGREIFPRIFYKDSSLVWRSPTHFIHSDDENWIGKGDLKVVIEDGEEVEYGAEETTNLPLEIQHALDLASRGGGGVRRDHQAIDLVLRRAPEGRFEPYRDFSEPRARAMADPDHLVNGGEPVAAFARPGDPASLRFVPGFEPDFDSGILEVTPSKSRLYGGEIRKYRILSCNRSIQYQFIASPRFVWIIPPQALTRELSSFGVRTVDVEAPEDLCVPGYEYHFVDETVEPPELHSQIPEAFVGETSEVDPSRADASPWLEKLPVIQEFRHRVLSG